MGLDYEPGSEATDVAIGDARSVVERDDGAAVGILAELAVARMAQAPRHPKVDQQATAALESDDQVLASALECGDLLSPECAGDRGGVERTGQALVVDLDLLESAADELRLEPAADGLDLGQLGHGPSVSPGPTLWL